MILEETHVAESLPAVRAFGSETPALSAAVSPVLVSPYGTVQLALEAVERRLAERPFDAVLLFQRACLLEQTGRKVEALDAYKTLLGREPLHVGALNNLGNLLMSLREMDAAEELFRLAIAHHPEHLASRANLGNLLIKHRTDLEGAREQFDAALEIDAAYRPAHAGLSFVLGDLGEPEQAAWHRRKAFRDRCIVYAPYRGSEPPIVVLELVSVTGGNFHTDVILSDRVFQRILVAVEYFTPEIVLPPHHLVLNAVGDVDCAEAAVAGAAAVVAHTTAPVINAPAAVSQTGRCSIAERLAAIPGAITAKTVCLSRSGLLGADAERVLAENGFGFPVLLRALGFHGGDHFCRVASLEELPAAVESLPGEELLAIEYLDARGADGRSRKYRVMFVGGRLYPLHLAISPNWKIHYFSADMAESAENRAEDARFLNDMPEVLGPTAMTALEEIQRTLGLDYGGIDFGLNERGEVLVFEANATMAVVIPDKDPRWDYRRGPVQAIYTAVWRMLGERARGGGSLRE
jgi:tetratricopeptide (TPR) repeat protein